MEGNKWLFWLAASGKDDNESEDLKIPYGYVWLVGENRKESKDSYTYGPVPYGLIQSR